MLITINDARFLGKYLVFINNGYEPGEYKLRDDVRAEDIPPQDLKTLKEFDDDYVLLYQKHMIVNYEKLFG